MALRAGDLRKKLEGIEDDTIICVLGVGTANGVVGYDGMCSCCGERSLVITTAESEEEYDQAMAFLEYGDAGRN